MNIGDRVIITTGEFAGRAGRIRQIEGDQADVWLDSHGLTCRCDTWTPLETLIPCPAEAVRRRAAIRWAEAFRGPAPTRAPIVRRTRKTASPPAPDRETGKTR